MKKLLEVKHLEAFYGETQVLSGISFTLNTGEITAVLGANGAGKTTTLRAVCQSIRTNGSVLIDGRDVSGMTTESIVRMGVAHVPDGRGTFSALSVLENLKLGAYVRRDSAEIEADIEKMFSRFPRLRERSSQQAGTLSGGEQQMLAISRALMLRPRILLLDEPSFGLAPLVVAEIFQILRQINEEEKVAMLLVEQNATLALGISNQAYVLETGKVAISGLSEDVKKDERVRRSYLGY